MGAGFKQLQKDAEKVLALRGLETGSYSAPRCFIGPFARLGWEGNRIFISSNKMAKASGTKYLFRGTTIGFEGNEVCRKQGYTCTSSHPAIGLLFAMECASRYPDDAVVYVAEVDSVSHLEAKANVFKRVEQEFVVGVPPAAFYPLTEGYIHYRELQQLLTTAGFEVTEIVRKEKLTELCAAVRAINPKKLETLMSEVKKKLKKV